LMGATWELQIVQPAGSPGAMAGRPISGWSEGMERWRRCTGGGQRGRVAARAPGGRTSPVVQAVLFRKRNHGRIRPIERCTPRPAEAGEPGAGRY